MSTISVAENISIKNIKNFHGALTESLKSEDEVIVDFSDVDRVDLSVIQVLMSAQKYVRKNKKIFKLKGVSDNLKMQLYISGMMRKNGE